MIIFLILLSTIFTIVESQVASPKCPSNMIQSEEDPTICYLFVSNATSFDDAEKFCIQNNGSLAPVLDAIANFFIVEHAYRSFKNFDDYWIGGKSVNVNDGTIWLWNWQNSYPFYFDWDRGEPSKNGCMASTIKTALWTSQDCGVNKPFVCQIPAVIDVCDSEWSYFNVTGMCYKYMAQANIVFLQAQNLCLNQQANLVSIHSPEENAFVRRLATDEYPEEWHVDGVFIGLQYENLNWKWLDGSNFNYENWGPDRPITPSTRSYAYMYPDLPDWLGKWENYIASNALYRFICEKKPNLVFVDENLVKN